jgi:hypothetical protein
MLENNLKMYENHPRGGLVSYHYVLYNYYFSLFTTRLIRKYPNNQEEVY